jgi:hypothetical protein
VALLFCAITGVANVSAKPMAKEEKAYVYAVVFIGSIMRQFGLIVHDSGQSPLWQRS